MKNLTQVVVIRGLYATEHQLSRLPDVLPATPVMFVETQGIGLTVESLIEYYSTALDGMQSFVAVGVSLGGLVALGLRNRGLAGVLALDPPLKPADDPDLAATCLDRGAPLAAALSFERNYLPLIQPICPTVILAGQYGAISDETLASARQRGAVTLRVPSVGHDITRGASDLVLAEIQRLLAVGADEKDEYPPRATRTAG